jgi:hypothetical protein
MSTAADFPQWLIVLSLTIFNGAAIVLLKFSLSHVNLKSLVGEKVPLSKAAAARDQPPESGADPGGAKSSRAAGDAYESSYSRVAGLIGSVVMAAFFWGLGNVLLYKAVTNPADVKTITDALGTYMLSGAAMFVPYAVNQLQTAFNGLGK